MHQKLFAALVILASAAAFTACSDDGGGGGSTSSGGTTTGGFAQTGTCESTCTKSIALGCSGGEHDQAACVASCDGQEASCSTAGQGAAFQTYLDCIESTPMECGSTTDAPSSPQCVSQGLAIFACALNTGTGGAGGGTGGAGGN